VSEAVVHRVYSYEEFEEIERRSEVRHEYVNGYLRAMAGGSGRHNSIAGGLYAALRSAAIAGGCLAHVENRRFDIGGTTDAPFRTYYPDVMVACPGHPDAPGERGPCFVAEVLSDSTAAIDETEKFTAYTNVDSVRVYAIVSQHERRVTLHRRIGDEFVAEVYIAGTEFVLDCPSTTIAVDDLYAGL